MENNISFLQHSTGDVSFIWLSFFSTLFLYVKNKYDQWISNEIINM